MNALTDSGLTKLGDQKLQLTICIKINCSLIAAYCHFHTQPFVTLFQYPTLWLDEVVSVRQLAQLWDTTLQTSSCTKDTLVQCVISSCTCARGTGCCFKVLLVTTMDDNGWQWMTSVTAWPALLLAGTSGPQCMKVLLVETLKLQSYVMKTYLGILCIKT